MWEYWGLESGRERMRVGTDELDCSSTELEVKSSKELGFIPVRGRVCGA